MIETIMVIGYGNNLRSDDGVGRRVVDAIATWHLSTLKSLAFDRLIPDLASTELVIFVNACLTNESAQVQVQSLLPCFLTLVNGHIGDPRSLLALAQANYGHCPTAWLVRVPGVNFEVGDNLSTVAETGRAIALVKIIQILDRNHNLWFDIGSWGDEGDEGDKGDKNNQCPMPHSLFPIPFHIELTQPKYSGLPYLF